jgi:lactoylglutathione lyase
MIGKLALVMIIVSDMDRSVAFYRDVLGLAVEQESDAWSQLDAGTISIGLHHGREGVVANPEGGAEIAFYVDDAHKAVEELRSRGAEIAQEPEREDFGGLLAYVKDPDGYLIQLLEF